MTDIRPAENVFKDEAETSNQKWGFQINEMDLNCQHDEDEDKGLAVACKATRRLIRKSLAVCRPDIVSRSALEYVNRRETGEHKNERPFYSEQKVNTIRKYSRV